VSQCLAICTGQQCFYMWSPDELSTGSGHVIDIPFGMLLFHLFQFSND
jgi:hypothetical protein